MAEDKKGTQVKRETTRVRPEDKRPERVPLHEQRDVLTVRCPNAGDYVFRWVNELDMRGQRVPRFEAAGWEVVPENVVVGHVQAVSNNISSGAGARKQVGVDKSGHPYYAILMRIRKEYYEEDEAHKQELVNAKEADLRRHVDGEREGYYGATSIEGRKTR